MGVSTPGAGERFTVTSFSSATSLLIAQNDYLPPRMYGGGLQIGIKSNSSWLGTLAVDNGNGPIDVTSFMTGAGSIGGAAAGNVFYRQVNFTPWKLWMNITSCPGNISVSVGVA